VNVSVWQLSRADMVDEIENALVLSGLAADRLELEVTEGLFMHDAPRAIEALRKLQSKGIHLSIDDFGTGYSSLSYLSSFPFNKLKIDKSFVTDLDTKATAKAIVKTIISLAQRLKVSVIAEGIETQEQSRLLQALGCREGQGFYFGRPLETQEFARMLLNRRAAASPARRANAPAFRTPVRETVPVLY
jgi:EAL domain-containing protein (putative c-di-GMP-specific phosphodiesterase class I)